MEVRLSDRDCLRPRLLGAAGGVAPRVEGVLEDAGDAPARRFVDAVAFDGEGGRYRVVAEDAGAGRWVAENAAGEYRPYARLIVDRLCAIARDGGTPALHRFPGGPASRTLTRRAGRLDAPAMLAVRDAAVTVDGELWLRIELHRERAGGWRPRAEDAETGGWLRLDAAATVPRAGSGAAESVAPSASSRRLVV